MAKAKKQLFFGCDFTEAGPDWSGCGGFKLTELPSLCRVRAVKGGKKYLRRHYSSLAVCMSARYPRLGQNTPLVQRRERKGEERESLTNRHSTTAAPHGHVGRGHTAPHSDDGEDESRARLDQEARSRQRDSMRRGRRQG